jgi:hypothetical protein
MPRIKWKTNAKVSTLALGLKSDVERKEIPARVRAGEEIDVTASMVKALEKIHGGLFEVVKAEAEAPEERPKRGKRE